MTKRNSSNFFPFEKPIYTDLVFYAFLFISIQGMKQSLNDFYNYGDLSRLIPLLIDFASSIFVAWVISMPLNWIRGLIKAKLNSRNQAKSIKSDGQDASSRGRLALLHYGVQLFSSFPITGIGPSVLKTFHNIYLQIAGSFGIIGLIAFFNYIKYLLRIDFSSELRFEYRLIVYVFLIYGLLNNNLADFYLYFPLGLCYSTLNRKSTW